ncbi:MAG: hypothetical protein JWQ71_3511 [Pedosphaera sp.]|nr:hypothetical protein [Pedosphaera sp.]
MKRLLPLVEQHLTCYKVHKGPTDQQEWKFKKTMTSADAAGVLQSSQFLDQLQQVERFNAIRMPVKDRNGFLKLLEPGYDEFTRTFTADNSVPILDCMPIADAVEVMDELLREFPFPDGGRSKAVALASMLTVFGQGMLPRKSLRPCFIFLANMEGAGKTLLVKCATVPVLGCSPTGTTPSDESEMAKTLLTAVMEAKSVIVFDNYKGRLNSASLEGFLTSQDWAGRDPGIARMVLPILPVRPLKTSYIIYVNTLKEAVEQKLAQILKPAPRSSRPTGSLRTEQATAKARAA